ELEYSWAELEHVQSELSKKEQLAAVGELAAAIAHEVRNPLAIIKNAVSGLRRPSLAPDDQATLYEIVEEESERLNQLVAQLLRFARPIEAARRPANLKDICLAVGERFSVDDFSVEVQESAYAKPVSVDPGLFELALENLLENARQAMDERGRVFVEIDKGQFSDGQAAIVIQVMDSGRGMDRSELTKALHPFFTTQPRGTGLGLPIVQKIADAHGGDLELSSEFGQGTVVTLRVPAPDAMDDRPSAKGVRRSPSYGPRRRMRSTSPATEVGKTNLPVTESEVRNQKSE
ncbi:MAG: ATP-binding protein, partial [Polyangiaceae bacterium]|nr:ATP-binding protein [Polyangiaceae bacterium]